MIRFVKNPNLPENKVRTVICGELCKELNNYLDSVGIERIVVAPNCNIDPAVKYHADMSALHIGSNEIIIDKAQERLYETLSDKGFNVSPSDKIIAGEYPDDIALNFTVIGDKIIGNFRFADKVLLSAFSEHQMINVKQGYCKCSCLIVNENAIITDDESICNAVVKNEIEALLIAKGDILLPGHQYGFIGGSAGKISKEKILFFGDITKHRDYKKIADFIEKYGCKIEYLNFPLTDFGGIIPLIEEV